MAHYNQFNNSDYNFWKNQTLSMARKTLDSELSEMHSTGFKPKEKAKPLSDNDIVKILNSEFCDPSTPEGLNHRLYVLISEQLGAHISRIHALCWDWFNKPWEDYDGVELLTLPDILDKNHQEGIGFLGHEEEVQSYVINYSQDPMRSIKMLIEL
jgi:hypothetical protein